RRSSVMRFLVYFCFFGILYLPQVAAEQWIVPGATNATADNGLHYATDLKLCNQGSVTASVTLDLIAAPGEMAVGSAPRSSAPATGFTSTLGIVLAAPNSGVDVRVFDASGNQLARRQVTGGIAEQRVALNSLAAGADLPIGRVEFYVTSGRALGYTLVTDNVT